MPSRYVTITQLELREVLAGQRLYSDFVTNARERVHGGAAIQKGPLTIDLQALNSLGVPLEIVVPVPGWVKVPRAAFGPAPDSGSAGPSGNIQRLTSLLDPAADSETRRTRLRHYELLMIEYRINATAALLLRRKYLISGVAAARAGTFVRDALRLHWNILHLRAADVLYLVGISVRGLPSEMAPATSLD